MDRRERPPLAKIPRHESNGVDGVIPKVEPRLQGFKLKEIVFSNAQIE